MSGPRKSIIVAMSENRVIGVKNELPWRLKKDLQNFKQVTMGHTLIMGRKTFESIGRPLPGRRNIVITRQENYIHDGIEVASSPEEALSFCVDDEVFIVGGAEIYKAMLDHADRIYLTLVEAHVEGDAWFPAFANEEWEEVDREFHAADDENEHAFAFVIYDRVHEPDEVDQVNP
jgi:dihydrofolate reductase